MIDDNEKIKIDPRLEQIFELEKVFNNLTRSLRASKYYMMESFIQELETVKTRDSREDEIETQQRIDKALSFSQKLKHEMEVKSLTKEDVVEHLETVDDLKINPDKATDEVLERLEQTQRKIKAIYDKLSDPEGDNYPDEYLGVVHEVK